MHETVTELFVHGHRFLYAVGCGIIIAMLAGWGSYFWRKDDVPKKWRRVGILARLHIFPIKSCAPLQLSDDTEIACDVLGLRLDGIRDRGLMLINDQDEMITARIYPQLLLIRTKIIAPRKLLITHDESPPLILDFCVIGELSSGQDVHTAVWGESLDAMLCGPEYDAWFSRVVLGKECGLRLIYFPYPKPIRTVNRQNSPREPLLKNEDTGTFHDTTSYMLMNLASIDELNGRLEHAVDPLQFRGNFYVQMDEPQPYAEDKWQWIRIGDDSKIFRVVAPCTRCILPNISLETGARDTDCQPLKMLKSYRMRPKYSSPLLGVHLGLRCGDGGGGGAVKMNDVVYVEDR